MSAHPEQSAAVRLTRPQREMLDEFKGSMYGDRHVRAKYRRTADVLVRAGLLRPTVDGWYEITAAGRERCS